MRPLIFAAAMVLAACSSSSGNGTQAGELGRGKFSYICGSGADAQCNDNADLAIVDPATNMPPIALGATFGIAYLDNDLPNTPQQVTIGDTSFLNISPDGTLFQAVQTGEASIFGDKSTTPEDIVHVSIVEVDHIEFAETSPTGGGGFKGEVTVPGLTATVNLPGTPVMQLFRVVPMTKDRKLVAGGLPCSWTSTNPQVATIMDGATKNIVTVQLAQAGTATLHVTLGASTGDVNLTVGM